MKFFKLLLLLSSLFAVSAKNAVKTPKQELKEKIQSFQQYRSLQKTAGGRIKLKAYDAFQSLRSLVGTESSEKAGKEQAKKFLKKLVGKLEKDAKDAPAVLVSKSKALHESAKDGKYYPIEPIYGYYDDDYYGIGGILNEVFYVLDYVMYMMEAITTSMDQEMITNIMTHVFDKIDAFDMDSVETFCANIDVISTEADCVAHVAASKEFILNLVKAPWMTRDVVYFWLNYLEQLITYDHVKEIVAAVMKGFGADGTIDGALDAAKNIVYFVGDFVENLLTGLNEFYYEDDYFADDYFDDNYYSDIIGEIVNGIAELIDNVPVIVGGMHAMEVDIVSELGYILPEIVDMLGISDMTDDFHGDVCYILGMVPVNMTHTATCNFYQYEGIKDLMHEEIPFCLHPDYASYYAGSPDDAVFVLEGTMGLDNPILSMFTGGGYYPMRKLTERKMEDQSFTCSMTLGLPGGLPEVSDSGNGVCGDSDEKFFFKTNKKGKDLYKSCKWLGNKPLNGRNKFCGKDAVASICPSTCCECGEDPNTQFVKKVKQGSPVIWACGDLAAQDASIITAVCDKNAIFEGYASVTGSCPETCGICSTAGDII
ncbi:predicted protein [Chaetoceros tenuissimus]|uniref:Uncharacterized protein n=1 Tax=Chaetoceros tenuissimus TaxID=426638 RepID=A0AAD3CTD4_9STRA|nr:predicted protein [Chaetoceros tenuissimus]